MKMTQLQMIIDYLMLTDNGSAHYKMIANELDILVPNVRKILAQGALNERTGKGIYKFNN